MRAKPTSKLSLSFAALCALSAGVSGVQAFTVLAHSSSLIGTYDYSDDFTGFANGGTNSARIYQAAVQPAAAYIVQNTYGHPSVNFESSTRPGTGQGEFSFTNGNAATGGFVAGSPAYPGNESGSATGFTQTGGGGDWGVPYGFRTNYVVQFDSVSTDDRVDISSGATRGIFGTSSLSIFFRNTGGLSLFNGTTDTPIAGFVSGVTAAGQWHNYAVRFDTVGKKVEIYVDQVSRGVLDLTTIAGGIYQNFSNATVSVGGAGDREWTDNFQVGSAVPEPGSAVLGVAALGLFGLRRKRK
jgi:MYXO-CTERM domain-containing protein